MLIVGYCFGIRSERKLCEEVRLHLAYRWFCRLDLNDAVSHHSTFSENRLNRFRESDILRHIFERVVIAAMGMGLVKGRGLPWMRVSWRRTQAVITEKRPMNSDCRWIVLGPHYMLGPYLTRHPRRGRLHPVPGDNHPDRPWATFSSMWGLLTHADPRRSGTGICRIRCASPRPR
jgi:transposase-like protein DUF772